jgi:hypothetical protein
MNGAYEAWNLAIVDRFLNASSAGRPVYLALDDDEANGLAAAAGCDSRTASESLGKAIATELRRGDCIFIAFLVARTEWRKNHLESPPPYVGLLALCVLAASRMASDSAAGIASNAYYPHLNKLLGRPSAAHMPPGFDQLYSLWEDLTRWLNDDKKGACGLSTVQSHPHFTNIGWALSQSLFRESDRRRLTAFFRSAALEPRTTIDSSQLWTLLRGWAHSGCGLSDRTVRTIQHATPGVADQIATIVGREFEAWDGELRDAHGRRRAEIALRLEKSAGNRRIALMLVPRKPDGFPVGNFDLNPATTIELSEMSESWYRPLDLTIDGRLLENGFSLTAGGYSLSYDPSPVIPLRASLELEGWISVHQVTAIEEHCVICHVSLLEEIRAFLRRHASHGWREIAPKSALPSGWNLIENISIRTPPADVPHRLQRLAPRINTATRLDGGLSIVPRQYLKDGEPDLWVTVEKGQDPGVKVDGKPYTVGEQIAELPLSRVSPPLPAGDHEVVAGGISRHFSTFDGFPMVQPHGCGCLGHILARHSTYQPATVNPTELGSQPPRGTVWVTGAAPIADPADLPLPLFPPVLLPMGFERYVVIGAAPGELLSVVPPEKPPWLDSLGLGDQCQLFDQTVPFDAQWLLLHGKLGAQVRALARAPCEPDQLPDPVTPAVRAWAEALANAQSEPANEHTAMWISYLQRADEAVVPA